MGLFYMAEIGRFFYLKLWQREGQVKGSAAPGHQPEGGGGAPQEEYTFFSHARNLHETGKSV